MLMLREGRLRGWGGSVLTFVRTCFRCGCYAKDVFGVVVGVGVGGSVLTFVCTCFPCACYAKDVFGVGVGVGVGVGGVAVWLGWFCYLYVLMNMLIYLLYVLALKYL